MTSMECIQDFLGQKRIAVVGVSRTQGDFSRTLFREFRERGYEAIPVNPDVSEIEGQPCYARVQDIQPPVDGALLMTSPAITAKVVQDCADAHVNRIWMHRGGGKGAVNDDAVAFCHSHGMSVIPGECPFMFLPNGAWFHQFHGLLKKISGSYPR